MVLVKSEKKVCFRLKRIFEGHDLWAEILDGKKTIEYRDFTPYWGKRLLITTPTRVWFTVGFPKNNLPRIEADITKIYVNEWHQIETHFTNVKLVVRDKMETVVEIDQTQFDKIVASRLKMPLKTCWIMEVSLEEPYAQINEIIKNVLKEKGINVLNIDEIYMYSFKDNEALVHKVT